MKRGNVIEWVNLTGNFEFLNVFNGISYINSAFTRLFEIIGIENAPLLLINGFSWFVTIYCIRVVVGVLVWLPRIAYDLIERWCL